MKNKWLSPQSLLVIAIVCLIFTYILCDVFLYKPRYKEQVNNIKLKYDSLDCYLDRKLPEIDSTLKVHSTQIKNQSVQIDELNRSIDKYIKK